MFSISILLVDDSVEFLESVTRFLSADPHIAIAGCAFSGQEALERVEDLAPDLVLMDLAMPGIGGLEATRRIKAQEAAPYVIIVTLYDDPEYRAAAQRAGADGLVAKSELGTQLRPLIQRLLIKRLINARGFHPGGEAKEVYYSESKNGFFSLPG